MGKEGYRVNYVRVGKLCAISVAVSIFIKPGIKIGKEEREGRKGLVLLEKVCFCL